MKRENLIPRPRDEIFTLWRRLRREIGLKKTEGRLCPNSEPRRGFTTEAQRSGAFDRTHAEVRNQIVLVLEARVASTGRGLSVRFVPPALSTAGLAEMRFVRHLLARRWVGEPPGEPGFKPFNVAQRELLD